MILVFKVKYIDSHSAFCVTSMCNCRKIREKGHRKSKKEADISNIIKIFVS